MAEYVVMPKADYEAACISIRNKTGKADTIKSGDLSAEIDSITGGGGGSSADVRYVTFTNASTGETFVKPVAVGDDCVDVVAKGLWATPTQESTAQYDYAFANSWSAEPNGEADADILKNITEDKTVYAVFTATLRKYTITWMDEDGTELPGQKQWAYGTVPSYTPSKDGVVFDKWTPTPVKVTGDATYTAVWATALASGTHGGNITWMVTADGTLTLSGTGAVAKSSNGNYNKFPWFSLYNKQIKKVVVKDGITSLPQSIFQYEYPALAAVELPETLTSLGEYCFNECKALTSINLPSGLQQIPAYCFKYTALSNITIPYSVNYIGDSAFARSSLTSVIFENTQGWMANDIAMDVTDPAVNATNLTSTYGQYYVWQRT